MIYNIMPSLTIAGAVGPLTTSTTYMRRPFFSAFVKATFAYSAGGTTVKAWVQCSSDVGVTWQDVCSFAFTTTAATTFFNISALTPVTTQGTAVDGTLGDNTAVDGSLTDTFRVKYTTTGTYTGATSLTIWMATRDIAT
jgi:hypothetical protein